ncbi:glycoside hydrolase family 5 protein [Hyaloscypha bicolor E]|uniref:Endoglucanase EG-II n=1 Tax=Hyaloscypha bicolor E TaxID=1095630 RepID=A0A2J6TF97_9HELO|nr:glycoside hydrolase family 5 protein [Hyaloscypha bicolor E]PMD61682.1 glycoside hydrolase family 5 protein [Hyaloscypha bicolor E]
MTETVAGQCGGTGWTGPSLCQSGWTCVSQAGNPWYSQCLPNAATSSIGGGQVTTPSLSSTTVISVTHCASSNAPAPGSGKVSVAGINIAGCEFGTDSNGNQQPSAAYCPLGPMYNKPDGPGQMSHFASQDKFNVFRLPVGWQYLTNNANVATGTLDPTNSGAYDFLVQQCLVTGAYCLIDIHNYARFNNAIIGQGGPTNEVFAALWASIATTYKSQSKVIFGLMNEPHEILNISTWRDTVQAAVTAIRNAEATSQIILLPGNGWTSALSFLSDGSGPALATVTNPDHSTTKLVFDIHKYLDSDSSGTSPECADNYISKAFEPLAQWLRCNGRMALLSETGGGSTSSCQTYLCQTVAFLNANSDVYLGYIGWAAGAFDLSYQLAETPTNSKGVWKDTQIVTQCLVPK